MYELLNTINDPADLRKLDRRDLLRLAAELRAFLIDSVSKTGGHLSSNLGTVELTIALHYVYDTPHDRIVWDVGHQTYGHKILTGRREGMSRLRMWQGISGFPRREESTYDTFGTAHSSTSISAAFGMAVASRLAGIDRRVVAVIGDGALNYRGENLFEVYYSLNIWRKVGLSLDYQRVQNPAYNADRGPVNFYGARLHAEF